MIKHDDAQHDRIIQKLQGAAPTGPEEKLCWVKYLPSDVLFGSAGRIIPPPPNTNTEPFKISNVASVVRSGVIQHCTVRKSERFVKSVCRVAVAGHLSPVPGDSLADIFGPVSTLGSGSDDQLTTA